MKYILTVGDKVIFEAETAYECEQYGDEYHKDGYTISMKKYA